MELLLIVVVLLGLAFVNIIDIRYNSYHRWYILGDESYKNVQSHLSSKIWAYVICATY